MTKLNENPAVLVDYQGPHRVGLNLNPHECVEYFDSFEGPNPYAFLSNFHTNPMEWDGHTFQTSEHVFAYEKVDPADGAFQMWRDEIRLAKGPGAAKSLGRQCPLDPTWEDRKYGVMLAIVREKFRQHPDLAVKLLATGDARLVETTMWGDAIWGVLYESGDSWRTRRGLNWLGKILETVRAEVRDAL